MPVHSLRCNIIFSQRLLDRLQLPYSTTLLSCWWLRLVESPTVDSNSFQSGTKDKSKIILPSSETWKKSTFLGFNHNSSCAKVLCPVHRNRNKPAFIITQREIKAYMRKGSYKFLQFRVLFMQDPFANTSYKKIANTLLFSEEGKG